MESFVEKLEALKGHHFTSKIQSQYFREFKKKNLNKNECIVLADFAENYLTIVLDEIQSFHWSNQQTTIHPFVYYYKNAEIKSSRNFCIISDHLVLDTVAVFTVQKHLIDDIKIIALQVRKVIYFSDGSSSQYKNKKNFLNLCHHLNDFGVEAEWNFFASCHEKNACDGIGGTTKREITRASLQRLYSDQILTAKDVFNFFFLL